MPFLDAYIHKLTNVADNYGFHYEREALRIRNAKKNIQALCAETLLFR